jgi:hypothetical protein
VQNQKESQLNLNMDNLFRLANLIVLPFWILMLVFPKAGLTKKVMSSNFIFLINGALYSSLLAQGISQNPNGFKEIMNPNLAGITKLFANRQSFFTGWVHFLTFDLFVARWIYFDSLERGKTARFPILLTFLAGPLGLLTYLTFRGRKKS